MPTVLSEKELTELQEIFNLVDANGSGHITQQELRSLLEVLRLRPSEEELYELFVEARAATPTATATAATTASGCREANHGSAATSTGRSASAVDDGTGGSGGGYVMSAGLGKPGGISNRQASSASLGSAGGSSAIGGGGGGGGGGIGNNSNGPATIDFGQFVSIMAKRVHSEYTPEQLRGAFRLFETEDVPMGVVSTEVLHHALMTYGTETLSAEEAARLLAAVDPDGTGKINYLDFVDLVTGVDK